MTGYAPSSSPTSARQAALARLDPCVRAELAVAAERWALPAGYSIDQTVYPRVYPRAPDCGGHWLLYSAEDAPEGQTLTSLSVSLEFAGEEPVAFSVSGASDIRSQSCEAADLNRALVACAGPLRQCTLAPATLLEALALASPDRLPRPIR